MLLTLLSNQSAPPAPKTFWVKISGIWKQAIMYVKIAGTWKTTTPYVKVAGVWK